MGYEWPRVFAVRQAFDAQEVADLGAAVVEALAASGAAARVPVGGRVAITAGSRGIDRIPVVLGAVAGWVRARGADPFILAAMGSHGAGTDAGQRAILEGYGVTEAAVGCPVRVCTEARQVGVDAEGAPVSCSRMACEADAVLVVNRVKPHTILTGEQGSGLLKMLAIGLGGPTGAEAIHARGLAQAMRPAARAVLGRLPILCGLALVENAFDRVCVVAAALPDGIEALDRRLQARARALLPAIPCEALDLLVVRRMGKNIAGTGMDPNVIGMHRRLGGEPDRHIERIVALDLTAESHGNAMGVGMADLVTTRLRDKIDWEPTYANALTSGFLAGVKLPITLPTDRDAIAAGLKSFPADRVRLALIDDTAHLERIYVTRPLAEAARGRAGLHVSDEPLPLTFTPEGTLAGPA